MGARGLDETVDAAEPDVVARPGRERHVEIRRPDLVGEPEEVREPSLRRIDVHGRREDVTTLPEDRLRAVSVVSVDVEERDARRIRGLGEYCAVIAALFR